MLVRVLGAPDQRWSKRRYPVAHSFLNQLLHSIQLFRFTRCQVVLLGRVNSVYRFFAWGMIPIGAAVGGAWVWVMERQVDRDFALRSTWFLVGAVHVGLFLFGRAKLTTEKLEAARASATAPSAS